MLRHMHYMVIYIMLTSNKESAKKYYKKSVEIKQNIKPVWTQILFLELRIQILIRF